jgi:AAA15 family ATPase/GTPase
MKNNDIRHLEHFQIENFKCFNNFELKNLGQVNLILGDNNSGKTSALEALLFNPKLSNYLTNLIGLMEWRNIAHISSIANSNYIQFFLNRFSNKDEIKVNAKYANNSSDQIKLKVEELSELNKKEKKQFEDSLNINQLPKFALKGTVNGETEYRSLNIANNIETAAGRHVPFVSTNTLYGSDLLSYYGKIQADKKLKTQLIEDLRTFIPDIEDIELTTNYIDNVTLIGVWLNNKDSLLPLSMFGDGTIKLFRYLVEIQVCRNTYICIDEIDAGIHYSRFESFWKTILKSAERNNTQLFITTHDEECLGALKNVLELKEYSHLQEKTKSYTLEKLSDESTKAFEYNFDEFEYALNQGRELRGGKK